MACPSSDQLSGSDSASSGCVDEAATEAAAAAAATACCCLAAPICLLEETNAFSGNSGPNEPELPQSAQTMCWFATKACFASAGLPCCVSSFTECQLARRGCYGELFSDRLGRLSRTLGKLLSDV